MFGVLIFLQLLFQEDIDRHSFVYIAGATDKSSVCDEDTDVLVGPESQSNVCYMSSEYPDSSRSAKYALTPVFVSRNPSLNTRASDIEAAATEREIQEAMNKTVTDSATAKYEPVKSGKMRVSPETPEPIFTVPVKNTKHGLNLKRSEKRNLFYLTAAFDKTPLQTKLFFFVLGFVFLSGGIALTIYYSTIKLRDVFIVGVGSIFIGGLLLTIDIILILKDIYYHKKAKNGLLASESDAGDSYSASGSCITTPQPESVPSPSPEEMYTF